jgi:hypothetical protein
MHESDNIVRLTYTYTASEYIDRSVEKPKRRGITRISQTNSKEKVQVVKHSQYQPNDENYNLSNRQYKVDDQSYDQLVERVKELEGELVVVEKEKIEMERAWREEKRGQLVESHYVACSEDVQKWTEEKAGL